LFQADLNDDKIRKQQQERKRSSRKFVSVYFAAVFSLNNREKYDETNFLLDLIVTYLTSIAITIVNFIAPFVFEFVIEYENYSPEFAIRFTLVR